MIADFISINFAGSGQFHRILRRFDIGICNIRVILRRGLVNSDVILRCDINATNLVSHTDREWPLSRGILHDLQRNLIFVENSQDIPLRRVCISASRREESDNVVARGAWGFERKGNLLRSEFTLLNISHGEIILVVLFLCMIKAEPVRSGNFATVEDIGNIKSFATNSVINRHELRGDAQLRADVDKVRVSNLIVGPSLKYFS